MNKKKISFSVYGSWNNLKKSYWKKKLEKKKLNKAKTNKQTNKPENKVES